MASLFSDRSWADDPGTSIATNSELEGLGVRSLLTSLLGEVWRLGPGPSHVLDVSLAAARAVRVVALAAPRDGVLPAGVAVTASLSMAAPGGTDAGTVTAALDMPRGLWCWVLPAAVTAQHLRLTMTSGTGPYLQFGRLWVGDALVTRPQNTSGHDQGLTESVPGETRRTLGFALSLIPQDEADALEALALRAGTGRQVLVIPRTTRADRTAIIGKFTRPPMPQLSPGPLGRRYAATIAIQEDR